MKDFKIFDIEAVLIIVGQCPYCHTKQDIAIDQNEDGFDQIVEECEQCGKEFVIDIEKFEKSDEEE